MKILNFTIVCALLATLVSCKKDTKPGQTDDKKEYEITFKVKGFTQEYTGIKTQAVDDTIILQDRYFKLYRVFTSQIFNSAGIASGNYVQTTDGSIVVKLLPGNYKIVCIGMTNDDTRGLERPENYGAVSGELYNSGPVISFFYRHDTDFDSFRETFAKSLDFTVGSTNPVHNIVLDRLVAQIQLNVKDAIPNNVSKIRFSIDSTSHVVDFGTEYFTELDENWEGTGNGGTFTIGNALKGKSNLTFGIYGLVTPNSKHDVTILALGANDVVIASKKLYDVTCSPNQITLLSGNLFGGTSTTTGTSIKADTTWSNTVIHKSF